MKAGADRARGSGETRRDAGRGGTLGSKAVRDPDGVLVDIAAPRARVADAEVAIPFRAQRDIAREVVADAGAEQRAGAPVMLVAYRHGARRSGLERSFRVEQSRFAERGPLVG